MVLLSILVYSVVLIDVSTSVTGLTTLICIIYPYENVNTDIVRTDYESHVQNGPKTFTCKSMIEKCCEKGCCSILPDIPWYIRLIIGTTIGTALIITLLCVILLYCRYNKSKSQRRRSRRDLVLRQPPTSLTNVSNNITIERTNFLNKLFKKFVIERKPPKYNVAIYLPVPPTGNDQLPTYEEATEKK